MEESQGRNSSRDLRVGAEAETIEGPCGSLNLLSPAGPTGARLRNGNTHSGLGPHHINHLLIICRNLPTNGGNFSTEIPSFGMNVTVNLMKN